LIWITLKSGNLQIWSTFSQQWSHSLNELRSPKQDSPLHAIPDWNAEAFHYELAIRSLGTNEILIEMREYPICSQELRRLNFSGRGTVAAPWILLGMTYSLRADGIKHNVPCEFKQVTFLLHKDRLEAPLENMPNSSMLAIEALRLNAVQEMHAL